MCTIYDMKFLIHLRIFGIYRVMFRKGYFKSGERLSEEGREKKKGLILGKKGRFDF